MKMRKKPTYPTRAKARSLDREWYEPTLKELIDYANERGVKPEDVLIDVRHGYYGDGPELHTTMSIPESDEAFQERVKVYETKLAEYEKWYEQNREEIEEHKRIEAEKRRIQAEFKAEEKRLALEMKAKLAALKKMKSLEKESTNDEE